MTDETPTRPVIGVSLQSRSTVVRSPQRHQDGDPKVTPPGPDQQPRDDPNVPTRTGNQDRYRSRLHLPYPQVVRTSFDVTSLVLGTYRSMYPSKPSPVGVSLAGFRTPDRTLSLSERRETRRLGGLSQDDGPRDVFRGVRRPGTGVPVEDLKTSTRPPGASRSGRGNPSQTYDSLRVSPDPRSL